MRSALVMLLVIAMPAIAEARTWRVNPAGTGDAPTLHAAMDSVVSGDVVLVEAGEYPLESHLFVPPGVRLVGESGAAHTKVFVPFSYDLPSGVISLGAGAGASGIQMRGYTNVILFLHGYNIVEYCIVESQIDLKVVEGLANTIFFNCLFIGGSFNIVAWFDDCIIYSRLPSAAIGSTIYSCDVLGSVDPGIDASAANLNFSLDPQFCGVPGSGNYLLQSTSPCLGANNPFGPFPWDIGPLGVGCGEVRVEQRTWGSVKALFRDP